jgi:hypothetical protein
MISEEGVGGGEKGVQGRRGKGEVRALIGSS